MAGITGVFTADFKSFYDAVAQARVKLKDFQSDAEAVAQKVDRVANAFSGRKLVQDAEIMTKAITEIGGATALTAKEQAQVNAKLAEAIEKYKALGQVAPKEMQDLEKATRQVNQETGKASTGVKDLGGSLLKMASAIGIAFSAEAVIGFVKSVFDSASQIQDMSEKLGISAEAVQRFTYSAAQAGASIDDVGAALFKMNQKLSEGDKSTVHALTDLNLKLADLRQMSPEQAFLAITDALKGIENPATRARIEVELLGKAGGALGAAIAAGFREGADAADAMANDTVKALADAQQAWENLGNKVIVVTGTMIAETAKAVSQITSSWRGFAAFVGTAMTQGVGSAMTQASATQTGMNAAGGRGDINLPGPMQAGAAELERLAKEREAAARKAQAAADKQKAADEKIFAGMRQFTAELEKRDTNMARSLQGIQAFVVAHRQAAEVISATLPAEVTRQWTDWRARVDENAKSLQTWGQIAGDALNTNKANAHAFFEKLKALPTVTQEFDKLGIAVANLGGILGSQLLGQLGATMSAFARVKGAVDDVKTGFGNLTSGQGLGSILSGFTGIVSGIGGIVQAAQAAVAIGRALFGMFDRNKGRDAVVDFAESMGGFDALQKQLEALGEEGARLWVKLTQGTDKGNPEQAAKNIAEVEEALRKHKEAADDVTGATEEQARATIETASEAERAMKALEPLLKANEDQWRAWGDVVNGQIDRVASALHSLALPNLSGAALNQSAPNSDSGGGTAVINLDGRQLAEAVVPRIPGVVRRYGLA
jgi:hypothetical protein